jgi:hypothetical protein
MVTFSWKRRWRWSARRLTRPNWRLTWCREVFAEGTVVRVWLGPVFIKALIDDNVGQPRERLTDRQAQWRLP